MLDKKVDVREIRDLGADNYLLTLHSPEQARLTRPGQFVMLKCSDDLDQDPLLRRPFSVFDVVTDGRSRRPKGVILLVKEVGAGTHKLARLERGDSVYMLGPQGRPFEIESDARLHPWTACLVAGGVGIAALYLLARQLVASEVKPVLFYGGRSAADLVLRDHFEDLKIQCRYTTEDGSLGDRGLVTESLEGFLRDRGRRQTRIYACGPWGMMRASHELARRYRVPCEVSLEARMGCSLGACMGCVVRTHDAEGEEQYLRVCQEGPVMNSSIIDWDTAPL